MNAGRVALISGVSGGLGGGGMNKGAASRWVIPWLALVVVAAGQSSPPTANLGQEPVLIERLETTVRFENDGRMRREESASMRVQMPQGVQRAGDLVFGYNSANERFQVVFVRVKTAEGKQIEVGADAVRDLPLPIERIAPVYSDYHEVHITVPGVSVGAEVSYDIVRQRFAPLDTGQFWFQYEFSRAVATRFETLTIDVPQGRAVTLRTQPGYATTSVESRGGRTIYYWHPAPPTSDAAPLPAGARANPLPPVDVQLTTFPSWAAVGAWYAGLQKDRLQATPELVALAQRLTARQTTERGKAEALYDYVAKTIRYVSLSFGIGRYQPHAAEQVLAHEYGDCKDQETLLAALMHAVGIAAEPALISTSRTIDPQMPSPAQFDHLITVIPAAGGEQWLDTTTSVAAFGMLMAPMRGQEALVIPAAGPALLERTPADPPTPMYEDMTLAASADAGGKLYADVKLTESGDSALALRLLFHAIPATRWPLLEQAMMAGTWHAGNVSGGQATNLELTSAPLELTFRFTADDFWSPGDKTTSISLPRAIELPAPSDAGAVKIGSPVMAMHHFSLQLPPGYVATAPVPVSIVRPYARYESRYEVEGSAVNGPKVRVERLLHFFQRELTASQREDYEAFRRAIDADLNQTLAVTRVAAAAPTPASDTGVGFYAAGETAFTEGDYARAIQMFTAATAAAAPPPEIWNELGRAYLRSNQPGPALDAFQKQIALNPFDPYAYNNAGLAQMRMGQMRDAAEEFEQQIKISPLDPYAHANLGELLARRGQYAKAIPELQEAAKITPSDPGIHAWLGMSLGQTGELEPAEAEFDKAASMAPSPELIGWIGFWLASHRRDPQHAQQYAGQAASAAIQGLAGATPGHLHRRELALTRILVMGWAAIGLAKYQLGDATAAIPYLRASWELLAGGPEGRALAAAELKSGHKREAAAIYAQVLAQEDLPTGLDRAALEQMPKEVADSMAARSIHVRADKQALAGLIGAGAIRQAEDQHRFDLQNRRSFNFPAPPRAAGNADLLLMLGAGSGGQGALSVGAVQWVSGDESVRPAVARLQGTTTKLTPPPGTQTPLVAQGILSCESAPMLDAKPTCTLVLVPMAETQMLSVSASGAGASSGGEAQMESQKP